MQGDAAIADRYRVFGKRLAGGLAAASSMAMVVTLAAAPSYADRSTGEEPDLASAVAAAKETGERVKIQEATTEKSESFATPDGKVTSVLSAGPVRFRRDGSWVPVDLTLQRQADGSVAPAAHPHDLRVSGARTATSGELASMWAGAEKVAMGWQGALPEPSLNGGRATYAEVLPGVDLVVQATATGFEQLTVVKSAAAAKNVAAISLPLTGSAVASVSEDKYGHIKVKGSDGQQRAEIPTPKMWDAKAATGGGAPKRRQVDVDVVKTTSEASRSAVGGSPVTLELKPDQNWLSSPDTVYPVTIDPIVDWSTTAASTTVVKGYPTDWPEADSLFLGAYDATSGSRSFVTWWANDLVGSQVNSAIAHFANPFSMSCDPKAWEMWTTDSTTDDTSWDNQPAWLFKEATSTDTSCDDTWVTADATSFFRRAAERGIETPTMGLRVADENDYSAYKQFWSYNYSDASKFPYVEVTYTLPAGPEDGNPETTMVVFSDDQSAGAATTLPEAYDDGAVPTAESESAKSDFIDQVAEESGLYYDPNALDYLKLEATQDIDVDSAQLVVPKDYHVEEVQLADTTLTTENGEERAAVGASVGGSSNLEAPDIALTDGPGFISFTPSGSGQYILKSSKGEMLATWAKSKMSDDKSSTYDYWQYQRKARVAPREISGLNWLVREFGIKSYPSSSNPMHHWVDWAPSATKHTGDCNSSPTTLEVSYLGVAASTSFQDCDNYTGYMRNDKPGDFSVNWNPPWNKAGQGASRETAFEWIAARKQPSTSAAQKKLTVNDYQYFRMVSPWVGVLQIKLCQSTNTALNC